MLDIGTGCGYLVKCLRDRGIEAYGIEISDYAIENSCAKGYVVKCSVEDIPFKDNMFGLVHSIGLWEYVDNVELAVKEVYRVGKEQKHIIDTLECSIYPEFQIENPKPRKWWDEILKIKTE